MLDGQLRSALERYDLSGQPVPVCQLDGTNVVFQVRVGDRMHAVRQFNPYLTAEHLHAQFLLARLMRRAGLSVSVPVAARDGGTFVEVEGRFWAVFEWCSGRPGDSRCVDDLMALAGAQGRWVACGEQLSSSPAWRRVMRAARSFRRRKGWAWVVPLDQVARFTEQHDVFARAAAEAPEGRHRTAFLRLLPEVERNVRLFDRLLRQHSVDRLPRTITHGDLSPRNILVCGNEAAIVDLDCFSFEPRITDFARAANWWYQHRPAAEERSLLERFQAQAGLSQDELHALPLMMCAHDLYYAVGHVLLFLTEPGPEAQARMIAQIESEMGAGHRFERERDHILRTFLGC